jgi:hypothetical protein
MTVLGDIDLSNTHIQFLPDGFTANRNLVVNNNAQFKHLPEGLTVLGDLCISRTSVHSLPENAKIGGDVVYSGTLQIPKSAVVSGTAYSLD